MKAFRISIITLLFSIFCAQAMELTHGHLLEQKDDKPSDIPSLKELCHNYIGSNLKLKKKLLEQVSQDLQEELPYYAHASNVLKKVPGKKAWFRKFIDNSKLISLYSPFFIKVKSELHKILLQDYQYQTAPTEEEKKAIFNTLINECDLAQQSIKVLKEKYADHFDRGFMQNWILHPIYDELDRSGKTAINKLKKIRKAYNEFSATMRTQNASQAQLSSDDLKQRSLQMEGIIALIHRYCNYLDKQLYPKLFDSKKSIRYWNSVHALLDRDFCLVHKNLPLCMKERCLRLALEKPHKSDAVEELVKQLKLNEGFDKETLDAIVVHKLPNS